MSRLSAMLLALSMAVPGGVANSAPTRIVDSRHVSVSFDEPPARVVSLLPSLTETVCELGACNRLVGVDRFSNWPDSIAGLPRLGGLEDTSIEQIVALAPDVVLAAGSTRAIARLEGLGVKVLALDTTTLDEARATIRLVARLLGNEAQAAPLLASIDARVDAAAAGVPDPWRGAQVYFEVSEAPFAAGASSFVGELLKRLGLGNVVTADLGPFPKLNPEYVVRAQPDLVMASARNLASMPHRPGWHALEALRAGHACGFSEARYEILIRPGPRLAEAAELLAACVQGLPPRSRRAGLSQPQAPSRAGRP